MRSSHYSATVNNLKLLKIVKFNPKQAEGGGGGEGRIRPQASSSLCFAETISSRKLKLCDFTIC